MIPGIIDKFVRPFKAARPPADGPAGPGRILEQLHRHLVSEEIRLRAEIIKEFTNGRPK